METLANNYFDEAIQKMKQASKELYRPEEDVVSYLVCKNAQSAIHNFLKGYLLREGIQTEAHETIENLYNRCLKINERFEKVNLAGFNCQSLDTTSRYCDGAKKVSRCFDIADSLDTFLRSEKVIN
jgi:HEPN domain-containing protein